MGDVLEYHKRHWDTVECQEIIGYMLYGYFDARKGWELNLEEQWMEEKNWKYADMVGEKQKGEVSNWNKGSIAKIISETKETQVKRIRMTFFQGITSRRRTYPVSVSRSLSVTINNSSRKTNEDSWQRKQQSRPTRLRTQKVTTRKSTN